MMSAARLWPDVWSVPDAVDGWSWFAIVGAPKPLEMHITFPDASRATRASLCRALAEATCDEAGKLVSLVLRAPEGVGTAAYRPAVEALRNSAASIAAAIDPDWDEGATALVAGPTRFVFDMLDAVVVMTPHET
jgi:hypothetical protein